MSATPDRFARPQPRPLTGAGFTLIEMLACVGLLAVLGVLGAGAYSRTVRHAAANREVAAARVLISAYNLCAAENDGRLMPAIDKRVSRVWFQPWNRDVSFSEAPHRYPFRLAPYFDYRLNGTIFVNGNAKQIEKLFGKNGGMSDYGISAFPAFGMNHVYVGGYIGNDNQPRYPNDCLSRMSQASVTSIIVFASAGGTLGNVTVEGYSMVDAPRRPQGQWSDKSWREGENAGNYGSVSARYDGKAVVAFLNGSVRRMGIEELRDMRLWSHNAALRDDPNYTFTE